MNIFSPVFFGRWTREWREGEGEGGKGGRGRGEEEGGGKRGSERQVT